MRSIEPPFDEIEHTQEDSDSGGNEFLDTKIEGVKQAYISSSQNVSQDESKASEPWEELNPYPAKIVEASSHHTIESPTPTQSPEAAQLQRLLKKRDAEQNGLSAADRALTRAMHDAKARAWKVIELQDEMDRVEHLIDSEEVPKALLKQWMALRRQLRRKVEIEMSNLSRCNEEITHHSSKLRNHQCGMNLLDTQIVAVQQSFQRCSTQVDDEQPSVV